jgi:hypothetical protein
LDGKTVGRKPYFINLLAEAAADLALMDRLAIGDVYS